MSKTSSVRQQQEKQLANVIDKEQQPEKKVEKIHLGETPALKRALDDAAMETLRSVGYDINYVYIDTKIALGVLACLVACIAQFYPSKSPEARTVLIACVAIYTLLSVALSGFSLFIEKDAIALTKGKADLVIRSKLPKYQEMYTLGIRPRGSAVESMEEAAVMKSVGAFFDSDGVLAAEVLRAEVLGLLQKLENTEQSAAAKKNE